MAARADNFQEKEYGHIGKVLREEIENNIKTLQGPPHVKSANALPVPIEAFKKRRGGRRFRQIKEKYCETELRKQAKRGKFGVLSEDIYQNDLGIDRGNIGKSGKCSGIRMAQVDKRTKDRVSQTLKKNLQKQQAWGSASTMRIRGEKSGTVSSIVFTRLHGLEIVNPQALKQRVDEEKDKYFSCSASFMKVKRPFLSVINSEKT